MEHFAVGCKDFTRVREDQLDARCDLLFGSRPIPFVPKKGDNYLLEQEIERIINQ
jgi:hypothetical protein